MKTPEEVIRACFAAYISKDRSAIESLIAEDFTFTSPLDDHIDRVRYFERCWPNSEHIEGIRIENLFVQGDKAFVQYELKPKGKPSFRNAEFFTVRGGRVTEIIVYFGADTRSSASEGEIRSVIDAWAEAIRNKDVQRVTRHFTPHCVRFDLAPPLQSNQLLRDELESWFATFRGNIGYEIRNQTISTSGDLACCHGLHHMTGIKVDGEKVDIWIRETLCLRQIDTHWRITHLHESVPFYMDGSFKAAVDLKPQ
jgi:ketosteroid isomerase-like protein